jgi:hypothetical protein
MQASGGLYEFKIVCDETNNTPTVLDQNKFVADVYIKIAKTSETITVNIVAVNTSTDLS